jgi:hypothetical protein
MPDESRLGDQDKGSWTGFSRGDEATVEEAIRDAVNNANQPDGTWLVLGPITVLSVGDPNVGAYKATVSTI